LTSFPQTIIKGDSIDVTVKFSPDTKDTIDGILTIACNDTIQQAPIVTLRGVGIAPEIVLSAYSHEFGDVVVDSSLGWILTVYNEGNADLTIDDIDFNDGDDFVLDGPESTYLQTVPPGDSLEIVVNFEPSSVGMKAGILEILINDPIVVGLIKLSQKWSFKSEPL
jgi:hypothetical protein